MNHSSRAPGLKAGWLRLFAAVVFFCVSATAALAQGTEEKAQAVIHMLDYVSVDYPQAVRDGQVADASEYQEQREFVQRAVAAIAQLPANPGQPTVLALPGAMRRVPRRGRTGRRRRCGRRPAPKATAPCSPASAPPRRYSPCWRR